MQKIDKSAGALIAEFEQRNSRVGLLHRYARGRLRTFWQRQIVTLLGSVFLSFLVSPLFGAATFILAVLGEAVDCLFLWYLSRRDDLHENYQKWANGAVATGIFQALTISACVSLTWFIAEGHGRFFAMVFLAGAILNAGLMYFYNHRAASVRLFMYMGTALSLLLYDGATGAWANTIFWSDAFSSVLLIYLMVLFIKFTNTYQKRRQSFEHELIQQRGQTELASAALAKKEKHFRWLAAVAENANDSVVISNPDRTIEWVNDTFTDMTGYSFTEAIGKNPGELLNGPDSSIKVTNDIINALEDEKPIRTEIINYTKTGQKIWVETSISPIFDAQGNLTMFIGIERDITATKQRETELALARSTAEKAAAAKSIFLATMSHEIRTPMNGIIGMADLLTKTPLQSEQREMADTIIESGESLLCIINDILDFSKLESGKLELSPTPIIVSDVVTRAVENLRGVALNKGLSLTVVPPENPVGLVMCDPVRLRQIALNLVGNALKFTTKGGVTVRVEENEYPQSLEIVLSVQDTGIGISKTAASKIFENFTQAESDTTRNYGGTGLGLSISKALAKQMGGDISVQSEPGAGSNFITKLYVQKARPDQIVEADILTTSQGTNASAIPKGKRVLVAEDNKTNRLLISKMFKGSATDLIFAENGRIAVEKFKAMKPDAVLMDMSMPVMNGIEATGEIRKFEADQGLAQAPIIALTANAFAEDRQKCLAAGMDFFLSKPVKRVDLFDVLSTVLCQPKTSTANEIKRNTA